MYALIFLVLGTHAPVTPTVSVWDTYKLCNQEKESLMTQFNSVKKDSVTVHIECVEVTDMRLPSAQIEWSTTQPVLAR